MRAMFFLFPLLTIGCSGEPDSGQTDRTAIYVLKEIAGEPFKARATITFPEKGRAEGEGPCNRWSAAQSSSYPSIAFGPIVATRRACPALDEETAFFSALAEVSLSEIAGPNLILSTEAGDHLVFEVLPPG